MTASKVVVYVSVTSKEQAKAGYSLEAQREQLRKYAEENDLEIIEEFSDVASISKANRQGFNEMLEYLDSSQDCNTVLVTKINKLCRGIETYEKLEGYSVVSIAEGSDKSVHQFSIAMATQHSKRMSERIKAGMQKRKEQQEKGIAMENQKSENKTCQFIEEWATKGTQKEQNKCSEWIEE